MKILFHQAPHLRAGASVIDVAGGMFGVIGVLTALEARHRTGEGMHVQSALFETTAYLVGQHMAQGAVTGVPAAPMPARVSAWAIYDVFDTANGEQLSVGVVTDALWAEFCALFGLADLWADQGLRTNNARVAARATLMPRVRAELAGGGGGGGGCVVTNSTSNRAARAPFTDVPAFVIFELGSYLQ